MQIGFASKFLRKWSFVQRDCKLNLIGKFISKFARINSGNFGQFCFATKQKHKPKYATIAPQNLYLHTKDTNAIVCLYARSPYTAE